MMDDILFRLFVLLVFVYLFLVSYMIRVTHIAIEEIEESEFRVPALLQEQSERERDQESRK